MSGGELEEAIREVMCAKPWFLEVNDAQVHHLLPCAIAYEVLLSTFHVLEAV
jgi:hypothetical protein